MLLCAVVSEFQTNLHDVACQSACNSVCWQTVDRHSARHAELFALSPAALMSKAACDSLQQALCTPVQDMFLLGGHNGVEWVKSVHIYSPGTGAITDAGALTFPILGSL